MVAFSDDFNRSDSDSMGSDWSEISGDVDISSNRAAQTSVNWTWDRAVWITDEVAANQYALISLWHDSEYYSYIGLLLRFTDVNSPFYMVQFGYEGSGTVSWNYHADASSSEQTIGSSAITFTDGDTFGVTIEGTGASTVVRIWRNPTNNTPAAVDGWDSGGDTADVTLTDDPGGYAVDSGVYVGIAGQSQYGGKTFDGFYAGDFAAGGISGSGAGVLSLAGSISRVYRGKRPASGSSTPAGAVSRKSVYHRAAAGAWSAAGALTYFAAAAYQEAIAGILSMTGTLSRKFVAKRPADGVISQSGTTNRKLSAKRAAQGTLNLSGSLSRFARYSRNAAGAVAIVGIVGHVTGQTVAGVLTLAGALVARAIFKRSVGGSIGMSGETGRQSFYARIVSGVLTFGGTVPSISGAIKRGLMRLGKALNFR